MFEGQGPLTQCLPKDWRIAGLLLVPYRQEDSIRWVRRKHHFLFILKFIFSKKATKIDEIFTIDLTLSSKCQIDGEDFFNFCGLLRKHELYLHFSFSIFNSFLCRNQVYRACCSVQTAHKPVSTSSAKQTKCPKSLLS